MKPDERLPLDEVVEEVKATSEDKLAQIVVPRLENMAAFLSRKTAEWRQRFRRPRRA